MSELNAELVRIFGIEFEWLNYIKNIVNSRAASVRKKGLINDLVTDVIGDIFIDATTDENGLHKAIIKAKSSDDHLNSMQAVVMQAVKYRVLDGLSWRYGNNKKTKNAKDSQFSQLEEFASGDSASFDVAEKVSYDQDDQEYLDLLSHELNLMIRAAEWQGDTVLRKRYQRALAVLPDRLEGMSVAELMEKHGIGSTATMTKTLADIGKALAIVAQKTQSPKLLLGTVGI